MILVVKIRKAQRLTTRQTAYQDCQSKGQFGVNAGNIAR